MPKTKISEFSSTPASNTDIDSINISEGCAPSGINDAIRELMAQLKDFQTGAVGDSFNGPVGTTTAAAGAFTTLSASGAVTLSGGTANGVAYLNGSKVVTSGSALVYGGSNLILNSGGTWATDAGGIQLSMNGNDGYLTTYYDTHTVTIGAGVSAKNQIKVSGAGGANNINFKVNSSDAMTLTSTGLGIGTSSPSQKLEVAGNAKLTGTNLSIVPSTATSAAYTLNTNTGGNFFLGIDSSTGASFTGTAYGRFLYSGGAYPIVFLTNDTERMRLDSSGNLGLGVTPSAWGGGVTGLQVKDSTMLSYSGTNGYVGANAYYGTSGGSGFKYYGTGVASLYAQESAAHKWYNAPSGTAGNAITFTQAMTLDASGNLLVGLTSSSSRLHVDGGDANISRTSGNSRLLVTATGVANTVLGFNNSGSTAAGMPNNVGYVNVLQAYPLVFGTDSAERARIDSSGNLLVGTTSVANSSKVTFGFTPSTQNGLSINDTEATEVSIGYINFSRSGTSKGSITYNNTTGITSYNTTSDYRAKDISGPVTDSGSVIDSIPVYIAKMKGATQERPMFIAHETPSYAHTGVKDAVDADGNPVYQQMDASALIPVMWAEIQSLRKRLADAGIA